MVKKIELLSKLSPGDIMTMTVAIESLHQTYPGEYLTGVKTSAMEIWENNPWITKFKDDESREQINSEYQTVHFCNQAPYPFIEGYTEHLGRALNISLRAVSNIPKIYLTDEEKGWMDQIQEYYSRGIKLQYWLICAGTKNDFTIKQWPIEYYQRVIDETSGFIQWVQIGSNEHSHHPLRGVIDLRGKTSHRQFMRLVYHSQGGLGPVTYLQHLCAAFEKPYMCILGGREPVHWVQYPKQYTFHSIGQLDCCKNSACWRSRVVPLGDGDNKDKESLCEIPTFGYMKPVAKCMSMIKPREITSVIRKFI